MSLRTRVLVSIAALAASSAVAVGIAPTAASATATNCSFEAWGVEYSLSCTNTPGQPWYMQLTCEIDRTGRDYTVQGSTVVGTGQSWSDCTNGGSPIGFQPIDL
jgi:hypothetical protein